MLTHENEYADALIAYAKACIPHRTYVVDALEFAKKLDSKNDMERIAIGAVLTKAFDGIVSHMSCRVECEAPFDALKTRAAAQASNNERPMHITCIFNTVMPQKVDGSWTDQFMRMNFENMLYEIRNSQKLGYPVVLEEKFQEVET